MTDVYYGAPFNLSVEHARSSLGTLTLTTAGKPNIVINLWQLAANDYNSVTSQWFWHAQTAAAFSIMGRPSGLVQYKHYSTKSIGRVLQDAMNAGATAQGWATSNFTVSWEDSIYPHYLVSYPTAFTCAFSTAAGQRLFGGNAGPLGPVSTSASATSQAWGACTYVTSGRNGAGTGDVVATSKISCSPDLNALDYNPRRVSTEAVSDFGQGYGNRRTVRYLHRDWLQQYSSFEYVHGPHVPFITGSTQRTYPLNDLIDYCGSNNPLLVAYGGFSNAYNFEVFVLREDGNFIRNETASVANHAQLHREFLTRLVGHFQADS